MYQEQARRHGQDIATTTDEGTFASGLRHITTVLPSLMNDITQHSPDSQKVCYNFSKKSGRRNTKEKFIRFEIWFKFPLLRAILSLISSCEQKTKWEFIGKNKEVVRHLGPIENFS